jgi:hypothetical protein
MHEGCWLYVTQGWTIGTEALSRLLSRFGEKCQCALGATPTPPSHCCVSPTFRDYSPIT